MNQQQFPSMSLTPLKGLLLLLLVLAGSLGSRPLAATQAAAGHQVYLPIVGNPEELDVPTVGYATGTDRTLIRWFCTSACDTEFEVYRRASGGGYQLLATVGREPDAAAAIVILNTTDGRWPTLYADLLDEYEEQDVTSIASLYAMLDENMLVAQKLANEYYPIALINGWGYLDTNFVAGTTYSYRVVRAAGGEVVGEVTLIAGQLTPLPAPQNVQALELDPGESELTHAKAADWGQVQADRRFHQNAYLRWDVGEPAATGYPAAWTIGYDIYRAPSGTPNALVQVNGEISVQPIAASEPDVVPSSVILAGVAGQDYQMIEHFYADHTPAHGSYLYRVAPRDALGQIRQWPAHSAQFSPAVPVTTYDFQPPLPPQNPQAIVNTNHTQVTLSWEMPDPPDDLAGFRIERTLSFSNTIPTADCLDDAVCWAEVATVDTNTFQWVDNDPQLEQARWYRLQAVDESGNRSLYTMPVHATLHDITPPGKPLLSAFFCSPSPGDPTPDYCLEADGDNDVARYLVGCAFWPDSDEIYLLEKAAVNGDMASFTVTDVYQPPFPLDDVACTVRAVDELGNISEPSDPAVIDQWTSEQPPALPNPILTNVTTVALDEQGNATALIEWEMPDSPLIGSFRIDRETLSGDDNDPTVLSGIDPSTRAYSDVDVRAGELYSYTVTAELKFGLGEHTSEPRLYRAISDGRRPLVMFELTSLDWNPNAGTILTWDSCEDGGTIDGTRHYAVFRSVALDQGYNQITPIFPATACIASYTDTSAQHGRYFYSIMEFDGRTGEPIGYTIPVQFDDNTDPQAGSYIPVPAGQGLVQSTLYSPNLPIFLPNCTAINPAGNDFSQPLIFGDGYEVHNLLITAIIGNNISGWGDLRVNNGGADIYIPMMFQDITVADAQNHVCTGSVNVNVIANTGAPILVTPAGRLAYQVAEITARPFFANISYGSGKVRVIMPNTIRPVDANGSELDTLNLAGPELRLNANLEFNFQTNISNIANHGCNAADDPILGFNLETMPTTVVPTGLFTVTPSGINMAGSCMDYFERYNPASANGYARPAASNLNAGDSNDGFLRGRYTGLANTTKITPAGLEGTFDSTAVMSYVASYPYGFSLELDEAKSLTLAASQIVVGSLGGGTAAFKYHQTVTGAIQPKVTVHFSDLTVDARGGLYAAVIPETAAVEWMLPSGFVAGLLNAELYLGQVTTDQRPGQTISGLATSALWATRPGDSVNLGLENPAVLEPGLNIRRADHGLFWKACPSGDVVALPAIVDSYIRHGGISERFQAQIVTPFSSNIHGYQAEIDNFDLSFLDNFIYDSHITGDVTLPFPADLDLHFISMWFGLDGCIGGGELLNEYENLAYWNTNVKLNHAVFADEGVLPPLPGYPHWDRVLRTIGALELPHLALPGQPAPTLIGVAIGFQPDGNPYDDILLAANRPNFEFDGFPLLLTGLRLSTFGEAAVWDANATAAVPPVTNWDEKGFVEVQGAIAAPYFGLLVRQSGGPGDYPDIQMQLHDDYVGFDEQLKGARVWVDLLVVQVVHEFNNLVYASSTLEDHGLLLGFREYEFVPDAAIGGLGLPPSAKLVYKDAAVVMEPVNVHFFFGQSSGAAAFRAMAEAIHGANPPLPLDGDMNTWAGQLNMSEDARDGYKELVELVWDTYATFANPNFRITTQVLTEYDSQPGQSLPNDNNLGGGTLGAVLAQGVKFNKMRGQAEVDGIGLDMQLEAFQVVTELVVQLNDEPHPILYANIASLIISRYGDYILEGVNIQSSLVRNDLALDFTGLYNPGTQALEAGVSLHKDVNLVHDLEMWSITLNEATGAFGLGSGEDGSVGLRYIGLNLEASWNFVPFKAGAFGGQVLAGTIDPNSPILQNHFPDVLDHLHLVPAAPGENEATTLLKGASVRLYGDTTVNGQKIAKVMTLNGGLRFGGWYWSDQAGGEYYGGLVGAFVHTNYLKVVSARGDITFTYERTPVVDDLSAEVWVAGGIGSCEPESWTSWSTRWWNDRWCWSAGAQATLVYDLIEDDFNASWQFDFE
ncbi:MAG: fibronectin type III domain-containing protein [Chloroflexi bacterium]|nr:fibronectin type III domain-containing protein [Chloroflexota bacterium]MCI0576983.1 fibronectin type III domain-containing protein [Chloroflexota bacterium]MCI0647307.1 fibronectin type III domain-containing protein [Chloroflexota bacterium]MCI0730573.1 fibronectin type III domain-containing protein [Chloroflexota bacterium]